ncbi:pirin family protein [Ahrensia marina]|uniref:Pirin n=1 Tax=Ahrensia marina TaxID=1514904 RepID=A0A0M9GL75_9HYPH|nr:pirin family protein [Ahrensia marina]KPB00069.1 pirin [Ahrensia marina]
MSWNPTIEPQCPDVKSMDLIETLIVPRARDVSGFEVRRALPSPKRQMVGPFIFFDQMGPAEFLTGQGIDVRPHPHIGLATVTYLYKGEFQHRDSLGTNQMIYPGEVNWMIAGNGVTHSERTSEKTRQNPSSLLGIQTWVALPEEAEETGAAFEHHGREALPFLEGEGKQVRLIIGDAYGQKAPTKTFTEMFYADAILEAGSTLPLPDNHEDRGIYVTEGSIDVAGDVFEAGQMMVFKPGDKISVAAGPAGARLILLGGATLGGPRHIWWNFVASSKEKIDDAKAAWANGDWQHGRFKLPPDDNEEFIPLP